MRKHSPGMRGIMEYTKEIHDQVCTVTLHGKFTFSDHQTFKQFIGMLPEGSFRQFALSMENLVFVDSAALGILLLLRDECERAGVTLVLKNPVGQVKKMFEISRFYDLFTVL